MEICERGFGALLYPCISTDWPLNHGYGERYVRGSCEVTYESGRKVRFQRERAHVNALVRKLGRPLRPGMQANHHCDNRACIRFEHLYEGTQVQNVQDMWDRKRGWSAFAHGHGRTDRALSPDQEDAVRRLYAAGGLTMSEVGAEFGISKATVSKIWRENPLPISWKRVRHSTQAQT